MDIYNYSDILQNKLESTVFDEVYVSVSARMYVCVCVRREVAD